MWVAHVLCYDTTYEWAKLSQACRKRWDDLAESVETRIEHSEGAAMHAAMKKAG